MFTTDEHPANCIYLGLGEEAEARMPTVDEQVEHEISVDEPVIVVYHTDRQPEVFPASRATVVARNYGVRLAPRPKDEPCIGES
jgi:hypothetical protein